MQRVLFILLALLPGLAWSGAMPAPASSSDAVDDAQAALMDGDFARAASLVARASGPEAARILGEALEAQGDLKGAASAYAEAAQGSAEGSAWLQKKAQSLQVAAAAAAITPTPRLTKIPAAPPTAIPTASATPAPTAVPTLQATTVASPLPSPEPTPSPTPAMDDQARLDLEKEKADLARQRQDLEDEKARLAQDRQALQKGPSPKSVDRSQGLTFYVGAGGYWPKAVDKLNTYVGQQQGSQNGGGTANISFALNPVLGLRWEGFAVEGEFLDQNWSYTNSHGQSDNSEITLNMVSLGYDWAFIRRGTLLGPVELALPLRVEFGQAKETVDGQSYSKGVGGPAFGLSLRCWATQRFLIELEGLYHVNPGGGDDNNDNGGNNGNNNGGNQGGSNSQNGPGDLSQEGPEARLNLGWRFF